MNIDDFILEYVCQYPEEILFTEARDVINLLLAEQRERCANKAGKAAHKAMAFWVVADVRDACIDATGEKDE